jgi:hypothetical protein
MEVGNSVLSIPSLTQDPAGEEKFKMMRADPFGFCRHIIPFTFAFAGRCDGSNGPAANPCVIQSAMASVTSGPNSYALGALLL